MPHYEVKNINNGTKVDNKDGTWTIPLEIISGIVGDTYGFIRSDISKVIVLGTDTGEEMDTKAKQAAQAFVQQKYPNN